MRRRRSNTHEQELAGYAEWEWHCAQVEAFVRERGHCNLGEHPAGDWLRRQLQASAAGRLSPERQQRLAALGVSLDAGDAAWEAMLQRVRDVLIRRRVPRKKNREKWLPEPLDGESAAWLREQRALHKQGLLHPDRARKLLRLKLLAAKRMPEPPPPSPGRIRAAEARERRHTAMWESRYAELAAYQQEHGDCDVPKLWPENQPLANWVRFQRKADHLGRVTDDHRARLEALGFAWSLRSLPVDKRWERRFQELVTFKEQHGHARVPKGFDRPLWHWRHVQREFRRKGILNPVRIARLDAIGFDWEEPPAADRIPSMPVQQRWKERLQQLAEFTARHGHCRVPKVWPENPSLSSWLQRQKLHLRADKLRPERLEQLLALGFVMPPHRAFRPGHEAFWEQRYAELAAFKEQHGHTRVTGGVHEQLADWRHAQRALRRKGKLSAERIARLDALGFDWMAADEAVLTQQQRWDRRWERFFTQLEQFHRQHGHCRVMARRGEHRGLPEWVKDQRIKKREGKMNPQRQARLEALGFLWSTENIEYDARWERRYQQLCAYQRQHGHTRVPKGFDRQLWHWRHVQREFRKKGMLSAERTARLDAIGFEWEERGKPWARSRDERLEQQWQRMFEQLVEFQRQHGATHVVAGWPENPRLAAWVGVQRARARHGGLRPDRKARLDALGFQWHPGRPALAAKWEKRYAEMAAFKEQHGHTRVPKGFDQRLWHWRHVQREFRKKGMLSAERIARLDALGFEWTGRDPPRRS